MSSVVGKLYGLLQKLAANLHQLPTPQLALDGLDWLQWLLVPSFLASTHAQMHWYSAASNYSTP